MPANPSPTYAKPPAPPAPPPTKIIKEGWGKDFCKVCSSSVKHSFLGTHLGCIQPKCSEYFEKTTKPKWTGMPIRNYETKLTHFVYFSDFDKDIRDEIKSAFDRLDKNEYLMYDYSDGDYYYRIFFTADTANITQEEMEEEMEEDYKPERELQFLLRQVLPPEVIAENKFAIRVVQ